MPMSKWLQNVENALMDMCLHTPTNHFRPYSHDRAVKLEEAVNEILNYLEAMEEAGAAPRENHRHLLEAYQGANPMWTTGPITDAPREGSSPPTTASHEQAGASMESEPSMRATAPRAAPFTAAATPRSLPSTQAEIETGPVGQGFASPWQIKVLHWDTTGELPTEITLLSPAGDWLSFALTPVQAVGTTTSTLARPASRPLAAPPSRVESVDSRWSESTEMNS